MSATKEKPSNSVLQRISPEAREDTIVDALCEELESAILLREKAVVELDRLQGERQREGDALIAEMEESIKRRDQVLADLERVREEDRKELAALRVACEAAAKERDELLRRIPEVDAAHQKQLQKLREQKKAPKSTGDASVQQERDAFKAAADKLLGERMQASKERDRMAAELAAERKTHEEKMETLIRERDEAAAQLEKARSDYQSEISALTGERDGLAQERRNSPDSPATYEQEIAFIARERDAAVKRRDQLQADLELEKQARTELVAAMREQIDELTLTREKLAEERTELSAQVAALSAERDKTDQGEGGAQSGLAEMEQRRDELSKKLEETARELMQARKNHNGELEAAGQDREEIIKARENLAEQLTEAREQARREIEKFSIQRDELFAARDQLTAQLSQLQEDHQTALDEFAREREKSSGNIVKARQQHLQEHQAITAERDRLIAEREDLAGQLAKLHERQQPEIEKLTQERDDLVRGRDEVSTQLAHGREAHNRDLESFTAQRDHYRKEIELLIAQRSETSAERDRLSGELEQTRTSLAKEIEALKRDRDGLLAARNAIAAEFAAIGGQQKGDLEKLNAHHEEVTKERNKIAAEFAEFRETRAREVETLTNERDGFMTARNELRDYLDVIVSGHREELGALRQEHEAVLHERAETVAAIERDRLSWRRQIGFFTEERDTLARERDEAVSELAHERKTQGKQVDLRMRECENLIAQRNDMLAQLDQLRDAQKHQSDLFSKERQILVTERDAMAAKLNHALQSLGVDRVTLLQKKLDAEGRLDAATRAHRQEIETAQKARDAAVQELDVATKELTPFRESQQRELAALGNLAASKYESADTSTDQGFGGRRRAQDTVIGREVEINVCRGAEASPEKNVELLDVVRHLGRLQHPGIPPIYEVGLDEAGRVYYTTKGVAGISLREILEQLEDGKIHSLLHFTLKRLLGVFHKVCSAVAYAHAQGIVHGALHSENMILGEFGEVFVTHWSLREDSTDLPGADAHGDVMALGRLLYQIATLEKPPEAGGVRRENPAQRAGAGARERAVNRPQSHYWDADANVKSLITVARRAFDRRAPNQFHSIREFQAQVDAFKDSFEDPVRLNLRRLTWYWMRRHRIAATVLCILVALVVGTAAYLIAEKVIAYRAHQIELQHRLQRTLDQVARPKE